jgi:hypothetical protein
MTTDRIAMRDGGKDSVLKIWGKLVAKAGGRTVSHNCIGIIKICTNSLSRSHE